jgi:magnesium chelatase family protein
MNNCFPSSRWWLPQPRGSGQLPSGGASGQDAFFSGGRPCSLTARDRLWEGAFDLSDLYGKKATQVCPCGYYGDPVKECRCSAGDVTRYRKRISGPLLDRIDIFVDVPRVEYEKLSDDRFGEGSEKVRTRVEGARQIQRERFKGTRLASNADATPVEVREFCQVEPSAQGLLRTAMKQLSLSARAFHRILKLARTIADLEDAPIINAHHLAEAIQYRPRSLV